MNDAPVTLTDRDMLARVAEHFTFLRRVALSGGPIKRNGIRVSKWHVIVDECQEARAQVLAHLAATEP